MQVIGRVGNQPRKRFHLPQRVPPPETPLNPFNMPQKAQLNLIPPSHAVSPQGTPKEKRQKIQLWIKLSLAQKRGPWNIVGLEGDDGDSEMDIEDQYLSN
jgi:hypothetical protein